jgi:uncharacterized protein (DUF427 family)
MCQICQFLRKANVCQKSFQSLRHVRVLIEGATLADTRRPWLVFEVGLPTRYYLPLEDVRMALLTPSETRTLCVYKGEALY